ncbi:bone morphogenetic protein receptor type-2-like, partial [Oculina patagonica]
MKDYRLLVVLLVITTLICVKQGSCQGGKELLCDSYHTDVGIFNGTETCKSSDESCFVLWREETNERNETFQTVIKKGCFIVTEEKPSKPCLEDCIQNPYFDAFRSVNVSGFCCCNVDMCNRNFTPVYYTEYESTVAPSTTTG